MGQAEVISTNITHKYQLQDIPSIRASVHLQELDSMNTNQKYLIELPEGKSFEINERLLEILRLIDG